MIGFARARVCVCIDIEESKDVEYWMLIFMYLNPERLSISI